ncbi:MAG: SDR family NAD(P)-dependent oxidoreductase, partial [Actinobacteria bacterium]|nr:SDR family NAD(P)-dependent oxidoreductase [Actinomycetota bacterium]
MKLKPLDEQVMVVMGASSGIGRVTAKEAARRGASVVVSARDVVALDALVAEIGREGGRALAWPADVSAPDAVADV